jgi:hypothetical protein
LARHPDPEKSQPVEIITLQDRTPNPIAKLFIDELRGLIPPTLNPNGGFKSGPNPGSKTALLRRPR